MTTFRLSNAERASAALSADAGEGGSARESVKQGGVAGVERESSGQKGGGEIHQANGSNVKPMAPTCAESLAEQAAGHGVRGVGDSDVLTPDLDGTSTVTPDLDGISTSGVPPPPTQAQGQRERAGGLDVRSPKSKFPPPKPGVRIGLGASKRSVKRAL